MIFSDAQGLYLGTSPVVGSYATFYQQSFFGSGSATITQNIQGPLSLYKFGNGTVILSGSNSYTNGTYVSAGIIKFGNLSSIGAINSNFYVGKGGTLDLGGIQIPTTSTYNVYVNGTGYNSVSGAFLNTGTAANPRFSGNVYLTGPTIIHNASTNSLTFGAVNTPNVISGSYPLSAYASTTSGGLVFYNNISVSTFTKGNGTGSINLYGTNTFTDAIYVKHGGLAFNNVQSAGGGTTPIYLGDPNAIGNYASLYIQGGSNSVSFFNPISCTANCKYLTIIPGLGSGNYYPGNLYGNITMKGSNRLTFSGNSNNATLSVWGNIVGDGSVTFTNATNITAVNFVLSGSNSYTGYTAISGGSVTVRRPVSSSNVSSFSYATMTLSTISAAFVSPPAIYDNFRLFPKSTTNSYAKNQIVLTNADTNVGLYDSTNSTLIVAPAPIQAQYLLVAGGGGGGSSGGGGAGGVLLGTVEIYKNRTYNVNVGTGGYGQSTTGTNGSNTTLTLWLTSALSAIGGGGGGGVSAGTGTPGNNGGSGGGAGCGVTAPTSGGTGIPGQGNNGGNSGQISLYPGGGGGGAGGAGGNSFFSSTQVAGNGGVGIIVPYPLSAAKVGENVSGVYYVGGGGGGGVEELRILGFGGYGGGGAGTNSTGGTGYPAMQNTGGGGGGGGGSGTGGSGGSGVIVLSLPGTSYSITTTGTTGISGGNTFITFLNTGSGTFYIN